MEGQPKSIAQIVSEALDPSYTESNFRDDTRDISLDDAELLNTALRAEIEKLGKCETKDQMLLEKKLWTFLQLISIEIGTSTHYIETTLKIVALRLKACLILEEWSMMSADAPIEEKLRVLAEIQRVLSEIQLLKLERFDPGDDTLPN